MSRIACLGILVADVVGKPVGGFPAPGTLAAVERIELHVGGCAASTAIALAKLGVDVAVLGRVGTDGFGNYLKETLRSEHVDTRGIVVGGSEQTSATMVAVAEDGERTFLHYPGANAIFTAADVSWEVVGDAEILHIGGPFLMSGFIGRDCAQVLRRARSLGKTTTLDTVWDHSGRWMSVLEESLPYLDYVLPSLEEARLLTGYRDPADIARVFLDKGAGTVGLKLGADGAYVHSADGGAFHMPPFAVEAVDTLGAGDAWCAGFLCGLSRGWDLERTARFANGVAACSVIALGATTGVRSFDETCECIASGTFPR